MIVRCLTRSLPAHSVSDLPVYVARRPPLHSVKRHRVDWRLTQTPYNSLQRAIYPSAKNIGNVLHFAHAQQVSAAKERRCTDRDRGQQLT
jgi:hypothetical protein